MASRTGAAMTGRPATVSPWDIPKQTWTITPGDMLAVGDARRRAVTAARTWCPAPLPDDIADAIRRVVSELVTNALRHAGDHGSITFSLWLTPRGNLAVTVTDGSPDPPTPRDPYDDGTAGRGLAVVAADTISWGWRLHDPGKVVTATMRLPGSRMPVHQSAGPIPTGATALTA